ncbi:MAG: hypothetical protein JWN68_3599 [Nocardioides sp.]|jgi:hypothetical protein|uniref:hypothetical protein n=1 Tax=Nocardioides sp. TaxID=35761 RepID=UPI00262D7DE2|nr:hypothetical protein [Nocardioides sp.]MCW2835646.1 hypothetical protein [Nocardioides sp.]
MGTRSRGEAGLRGLPSLADAGRATRRDDRFVEGLRLASRLSARATVGDGVLPPATHSEVALELRELLPVIDDDVFDQHMSRLDRAARFVSAAEVADADDVAAYADAAWGAGLDPADFAEDAQELRTEVIQHWDLALLDAVSDLVAADDSTGSVAMNLSSDARAG